jgi:hypothetical protein
MRLVAASVLVLAIVIAVAVTTKVVGHHSTCTYTTSGNSDPYFNPGTQSCMTRTGLW